MKVYLPLAALFLLGLVHFSSRTSRSHLANPPAGPLIEAAGQMIAPRADHSMTLLQDGRVLIVGGCTGNHCDPGPQASTAELFDPRNGVFTQIASMADERLSHTATRLMSGDVLITGGWQNRRATDSVELYDVEEETFKPMPAMHHQRASHTQTLLDDGRVLLTGGYNGQTAFSSAELYDPATDTFTPTGSMNYPRNSHIAIKLQDGRVLIIGGGNTYSNVVLAAAEVYDPATGEFTETGSMGTPRYKHSASLLHDGRVLVVGGSNASDFYGRYNSTELYDPATGRFTPAPPMNSPRFKLAEAVVTLDNGLVLVAGGDEYAEFFHPENNRFIPVPGSMKTGRSFSAAVLLPDGDVLITGGYDHDIRVSDSAWRFSTRH